MVSKFLMESYKAIFKQPEDLKRTLIGIQGKLDRCVKYLENVKRIILIGCGDSYFAALAGMYMFEEITNIKTYAENSYEFLTFRKNLDDKDLVIAISASGRTAKTVEAARCAKEKGVRVFALTNTANSPLTKFADISIYTAVERPYGPPTATSTAAMLAIAALAMQYSRVNGFISNDVITTLIRELNDIPSKIGEMMSYVDNMVDKIIEVVLNTRIAYLIGGGPSFATALFGMAKLREVSWMHSIAFEVEEFCHYGMISIDPSDTVILIAPSGKNIRRVKELYKALRRIKAKTILVMDTNSKNEFSGDGPSITIPRVHEIFSPIVFVIPLQLLAIKLAMKRGMNVRGFRYGDILSKLIGYYE